jgi:hypothetical protein
MGAIRSLPRLSPAPFSGAVYILGRERGHPVDASVAQTIQAVSRWRSGSRDLVAALKPARCENVSAPTRALPRLRGEASEGRVGSRHSLVGKLKTRCREFNSPPVHHFLFDSSLVPLARAASRFWVASYSGIPAFRRPRKYVVSKRARTVGTPKYPTAFKRAMLE